MLAQTRPMPRCAWSATPNSVVPGRWPLDVLEVGPQILHRVQLQCMGRRASWLVQTLAKTGRRTEAAELLAEMVAPASSLGRHAEEADPVSHQHLGNSPRALTHARPGRPRRQRRQAGPAPPAEAVSAWQPVKK